MKPTAPVVSTRRLFESLLSSLDIDAVCDIGSMDGTDALRFRRHCGPAAVVIAFEANPGNFERMRTDSTLDAANIRREPLAVSDDNGRAEFFVVRAPPGPECRARRGMSSLYRRPQIDQLEEIVQVETTRLDTYLAQHAREATCIALWIDVEGKAFEVLAGARDVLRKVQLLHIEVERTPLIADVQRTYSDVYALLESSGFVEVATDHPVRHPQFNTLWMRAHQPLAIRRALQQGLVRERCRRFARDIVYWVLPRHMRSYLSGRFGLRRMA